jgi:hypothetical protein
MSTKTTRIFKIIGLAWTIGWLLTWALDVRSESQHPADYSVTSADGTTRFRNDQFVVQMIDHGVVLFFLWLPADCLQIGLRIGWVCQSHEIGRC